ATSRKPAPAAPSCTCRIAAKSSTTSPPPAGRTPSTPCAGNSPRNPPPSSPSPTSAASGSRSESKKTAPLHPSSVPAPDEGKMLSLHHVAVGDFHKLFHAVLARLHVARVLGHV